jgi:hypothetical protein
MIAIYHAIDMIPFLMASILLVFTPTRIKNVRKDPLFCLIIVSIVLYLIAQSSWFSSYVTGHTWGRDLANWVWFFFNTSVMSIYGYIVIFRPHKKE